MAVISGQLGLIASLATESTGGEILAAFLDQNGLRSDLRVPNLKNFPGGTCPLTPLGYSHISARNGRTSLKELPSAQLDKGAFVHKAIVIGR